MWHYSQAYALSRALYGLQCITTHYIVMPK